VARRSRIAPVVGHPRAGADFYGRDRVIRNAGRFAWWLRSSILKVPRRASDAETSIRRPHDPRGAVDASVRIRDAPRLGSA
jgi:hypothetical protein